MDKELEVERMKLELMKVTTARMELEFVIKQRMSEIKRVQDNIQIQMARELELKSKIDEAIKAL